MIILLASCSLPHRQLRKCTFIKTAKAQQQANQLPPLEKLQLVELLLADLDKPDPEIDAIWREVIMVRQGSHELVEWLITNGLFQNYPTLEG